MKWRDGGKKPEARLEQGPWMVSDRGGESSDEYEVGQTRQEMESGGSWPNQSRQAGPVKVKESAVPFGQFGPLSSCPFRKWSAATRPKNVKGRSEASPGPIAGMSPCLENGLGWSCRPS
ncbi:hypothetical protein CGRA01v4_10933 [Colletotrichum graminicola]|nr:hypothetical protein CGRA01v4_10933 [Colletotrichum graminicola]